MKYSYLFVLMFLLLWGCESSGTKQSNTLDDCPQVARLENDGSLLVGNLSLFKQDVKTIPLSELLEDFRIIKLDDRPEALVKSGMTFITDNYIGFGARYDLKEPYKLFDRQGNYISSIGSIGQGAGEYTNIYADYIDEKNGRVYILPWNTTSVLVYDMQGNFLDPIRLPYRVPKGIMYVDGDKERLFIGALPFANYGVDAVFWEQDFQGNVIHEIEPGHMLIDPADFSNEISSFKNTVEKDLYIFYWAPRQDSLYHYDDTGKKLKPVFTIDFKDDLVMHDYGELPGHFLANVTTDFKSGVQGDHFATEAGKPAYELIIDKKTLKGTYYELVNDYLGNIPIVYRCIISLRGIFL